MADKEEEPTIEQLAEQLGRIIDLAAKLFKDGLAKLLEMLKRANENPPAKIEGDDPPARG